MCGFSTAPSGVGNGFVRHGASKSKSVSAAADKVDGLNKLMGPASFEMPAGKGRGGDAFTRGSGSRRSPASNAS